MAWVQFSPVPATMSPGRVTMTELFSPYSVSSLHAKNTCAGHSQAAPDNPNEEGYACSLNTRENIKFHVGMEERSSPRLIKCLFRCHGIR